MYLTEQDMADLLPLELLEKARAAHGRSDFAQSIKECNALLELRSVQGNGQYALQWRAMAHTQKSFSLYHAKDYENAHAEATHAQVLARRAYDMGQTLDQMQHPAFTLGRAQWMAGESLAKIGKPSKAQEMMVKARQHCAEAGEHEFVEALDSSMVRIYLDAHRPKEALELAHIVYDKRAKKNDIRLATSELNLAEALRANGDFGTAEAMAKSALERRIRDNDIRGDGFWSPHKIAECEQAIVLAKSQEGVLAERVGVSAEYLMQVKVDNGLAHDTSKGR